MKYSGVLGHQKDDAAEVGGCGRIDSQETTSSQNARRRQTRSGFLLPAIEPSSMAGRQRPAHTEEGPQTAHGGHGVGDVYTPSALRTC